MVTAASAPARPRAGVRLLGMLLPPGIRRRQRDEWAADLAELGPAERRRYLFWAAWTLPALWVAAGRRGLVPPAPATTVERGPATTVARVLLLALAWPAGSWVLAVPVRLLFHRQLDWLDQPVTIPVQAMFVLGAYSMITGAVGLLLAAGLSLVAVGATQRGRTPRYRGLVILGGLVAVLASIPLAPHAVPYRPGALAFAYPLAAVAAVLFATLSRGPRARLRVALVVAALFAAAVWLAQRSPTGQDLNMLFMD
ncbi:hypothetical protein [Dactylosporangium matsuzakiense]|uniref:Uncharacterized protein n=1 Tax=Dactylosporangium matsuzakiense TaxID=53360 RepID=A0A9W6NNT6_9ACTN|nr:hypothetical protein [Dactylosporangium matsuzakiense]UWZ45508.1 hypothetical protein Dmats_02955 [Dactylosporangium matsuzakiense]GLL04330.1 hypothetical protein GCM10017581_060770 [Dactylosporangium matsuzakiense]